MYLIFCQVLYLAVVGGLSKINTLRIVLYGGEYDQPSHKEMLRLRAHCPQLTNREM